MTYNSGEGTSLATIKQLGDAIAEFMALAILKKYKDDEGEALMNEPQFIAFVPALTDAMHTLQAPTEKLTPPEREMLTNLVRCSVDATLGQQVEHAAWIEILRKIELF